MLRLSRYMARLGGAMILFAAFPISIDVITRKLFSVSVLESYEISQYLFAVAVAFGYAYAFLAGAHIRVDVIYARLPLPARVILDVIAVLALALVAGTLAQLAWETAAQSYKLGARSNTTLGVPLVWPQALWALGISWFAVVTIAVLAKLLWTILRGRAAAVPGIVKGADLDANIDHVAKEPRT